jgi:hypothetical protein
MSSTSCLKSCETFFDANGCNIRCWVKFRNFLTTFAYYCKYLLIFRNKCKKLVTFLTKYEILLELLLLVQYVVKKVSSDSEKVMMYFTTEAYMSHTCHYESPRDVHPYVGRLVQVA